MDSPYIFQQSMSVADFPDVYYFSHISRTSWYPFRVEALDNNPDIQKMGAI